MNPLTRTFRLADSTVAHSSDRLRSPFLALLVVVVAGVHPAFSDVRLNLGDEFQPVINAHPPGTTFRIAAGVHRMQTITPKHGSTFIGENGAVMKGSRVLDSSLAQSHEQLSYWTGQVDIPKDTNIAYGSRAASGWENAVYYLSELFVDGVRFQHMNSVGAIQEDGQWHYDETASRVYMFGSPSSKLVEISVTRRAFNVDYRDDVTIENLVVTQYATEFRPQGAIQGRHSQRMTLRNVQVTHCHTAGVGIGADTTMENCRITDNGAIGIAGGEGKAPVFIRNNKFAYNNVIGYSPVVEEGAIKVMNSDGGIFEHNWLLDNNGLGLWYDVYNAGNLIRSNLVETTPGSGFRTSRGIYYEISGDDEAPPTAISWNVVRNAWDGGVNVNQSQNTMVFENALIDIGARGIIAVNGNRYPGLSQFKAWGNDILVPVDGQSQIELRGDVDDGGVDFIDGNITRGSSSFRLWGSVLNFAGWQAAGYDVNGTHTAAGSEPSLPQWAIPFEVSHYGVLPLSRTLHWRLDEVSGVTAFNSAINGINGTIHGNPSLLPNGGMKKGAFAFHHANGVADYVDGGPAIGGSGALTVAFWMKPSVLNTGMIPVSKLPAGAGSTGWAFYLGGDGDIHFRVGSNENMSEIRTGPGSYGNNWIHVAGTFSHGNARLYVNGVLLNSRYGIPQSTNNTTAALRLGVPAAAGAPPYYGALDDIQIYSNALSATEIKSLSHGLAINPIGYWPLDDVSSPQVRDHSLNEHDGIPVNDPVSLPAYRGYGFAFDGASSHVSIPHAPGLSVSGSEVTLSAWIAPTVTAGQRTIISKGPGLELSIRDGRPRLELILSSGVPMRAETVNVEVTPGVFRHVAAVRRGNVIAIYVDGVRKLSNYLDPRSFLPLQSNTAPVEIGRRSGGGAAFSGIIDEVRMYNAALSALENALHVGIDGFVDTGVVRELWTGIPGGNVSAIPVNTPPDSISFLYDLEGPANAGDDYGARVRGYITPQFSGQHIFWVAGDNHTQFHLSTNETPGQKALLASVATWTDNREWNKLPSQKSAPVTLTAGERYYFEVLHKEGIGGDHFAVGWAQPGQPTVEPSEIVPGAVLSQYRGVARELWTGIPGGSVAAIPLDTPPDSISYLNDLEGPVNAGDDFGARVRGFITPQSTGLYTFWIAGDNQCRFSLSPTTDPADKVLMASASPYTNFREWTKYPSQKSAQVQLVAGERYYFEILHKEAAGGDHVSVGWAKPGEDPALPSEVVPNAVLSPW